MTEHQEAVNVVRGMALSAAAAIAGTEAVRTQVTGEHDSPHPFGVRVFVGERSAVVRLEHVLRTYVSLDNLKDEETDAEDDEWENDIPSRRHGS